MPPRDARLFLEDARDACEAIVTFSSGRTYDDFLADRMFRDAWSETSASSAKR
ncbi:MAG: DUF86 domain-containing protein [Phycisphaerales bacterium]